jgi:hypothetical protein
VATVASKSFLLNCPPLFDITHNSTLAGKVSLMPFLERSKRSQIFNGRIDGMPVPYRDDGRGPALILWGVQEPG